MHDSIRPRFLERWRIIFWVTLGLLSAFAVTPRGYAQALDSSNANVGASFPYTKTFIISSYYTPLPDQSRYVTGSFEGDVRLNGEGVHSADGSLVYPGMAAAPSSFPFGTKLQIPGIGIVAVHDRGGAIKNNRLDIWVGQGEEGLRRALGWGMRTVPVTVYGIDPAMHEAVNFTDIPLADLAIIPERTKYFKADIALGDTGGEVRELQRFLKKIGYFDEEITGNFGDETAAAVTKFQLSANVIDGTHDQGSGNFGPRSRYALEAMLDKKQEDMKKELPNPPLQFGNANDGVRKLQASLKTFGYLAADHPAGKFDDATKNALIGFQMDADLVKSAKDFGAGFYGLQSRAALAKIIDSSFTPETTLIAPSKSRQSEMADVFVKPLAFGDHGESVATLQEELARLHFFGLAPTGYYGKATEHAVFKFQQAFGIVAAVSEQGSGILGPQSEAKLNVLVASRVNQGKMVVSKTQMRSVVVDRVADEHILLATAIPAQVFSVEVRYGARGGDVLQLQKVLQRLGFFQGRLTTDYFGDMTKKSVAAFQKSHGLDATGDLDDGTRRILNQIITPAQSS